MAKGTEKTPIRITEVGHSTMLVEMTETKILTDPWFSDPILGVVTHAEKITLQPRDIAPLDVILISHGHFDHCDLKALAQLDKSAVVVLPDAGVANRIGKLGFHNIVVLSPWESKSLSRLTITALPADHPVKECTYVISDGVSNVFFGGDTRYVKELQEIGEKFDISVAMLPINGLSFPFVGKVVMDPVEAAEAAVQLKARTVIPIHYNISLTVPGLKRLFDRSAPGTPELFIAELRKRNRHVRVVTLRPGQSWQDE